MNEKYIIGAAVGFAVAYLLLNRQQAPPPSKPAPKAKTTLPGKMQVPSRAPSVGYGGGFPYIAVRPWSQQLPLHA